jgi:hypothetical protein
LSDFSRVNFARDARKRNATGDSASHHVGHFREAAERPLNALQRDFPAIPAH